MPRSALLVIFCCTRALSGATITSGTGGPPVTHDEYTVTLTPNPVEHLGTTDPKLNAIFDTDLKLMTDTFGNFTAQKGTGDAPGTFNVLQYDPFALNFGGGANFSVIYDDAAAQPRTDYEWIQIAHYHNWGASGSGDKVDGQKGTSFPFYYPPPKLPTQLTSQYQSKANSGDIWNDKTNYPAQKIQNPAGGGKVPAGDLLFNDQPYCLYTCADTDGKAYAYFDLYLVQFTWNGDYGKKAGGTITVLDGIRWGVEITKTPKTFDDPGKIPEPATYLSMAGGLIAAGLLRRRRRYVLS